VEQNEKNKIEKIKEGERELAWLERWMMENDDVMMQNS
jgi:hypothetical protein